MTYFLVHLILVCTAPNKCVLQQTVLDAYRNQEVCRVVQDKLTAKLPDETFRCIIIQSI